MHIKTEYPHRIREIENSRILMSDGTRLAARIRLPVRPPGEEDTLLPPFAEPEGSAPQKVELIRTSSRQYTLQNDVVRNEFKLIDARDGGRRRIVANGMEHEIQHTNTYRSAS